MIKEEFEDINMPRRRKLRSQEPMSLQDENEKLIREKHELEKYIDKLDFFNKLLEKELSELKRAGGAGASSNKYRMSDPYFEKKTVSRTAFYALLLVAITLFVFVAYSFLTGKAEYPFLRRLQGKPPIVTSVSTEPVTLAEDANTADLKNNAQENSGRQKELSGATNAATPASSKEDLSRQKKADDRNTRQRNTETSAQEQNDASRVNDRTDTSPAGTTGARNTDISKSGGTSVPETPVATEKTTKTENNNSAIPVEERTPIGYYKVVSKANFYNQPSENSLTGSFIYQFSPVTLEALDETDDFIFVVSKNNQGTISKAWLSKKDLRRIDK